MVRPLTLALGALMLVTALCAAQPSIATDGVRSRHYDARGLDSCNAPTHSQMAAFWHQSHWWWWGVYLGGVNRACPNNNLTAHWIARETRRGWGLQPIWVGLQAPCARQSGLATMSHDRDRAWKQGREAARRAYATARRLGLSRMTPIVYDMEAFDTSRRRCLRAVETYVSGWSYQLNQKTLAVPGYYGSSCASALTAIWHLRHRPAYVWGANYGSGRRVRQMSCVASDIWPHRLKQFAGGSHVSQNGVTLNVDKDCALGPMYARHRRVVGVC
jgi:hypothetical protein